MEEVLRHQFLCWLCRDDVADLYLVARVIIPAQLDVIRDVNRSPTPRVGDLIVVSLFSPEVNIYTS